MVSVASCKLLLPSCREREHEGFADKPIPAYCCWQGVQCCHEHSIYTYGRRAGCSQNAVLGLQLRAGNLTGQLSSVMEELAVLHQHGMTALDLSRNQITQALPAELGQLTNLQALLLGANSESRFIWSRGAC